MMESLSFLPVNGTGGAAEGWVNSDSDPWSVFMANRGFFPIRWPNGQPWNWNGKINGLLWTGTDDWDAASESFVEVLESVDVRDRNVIALSHGGQPVLRACARGFRIRTLTTVGTPRRHDGYAEKAAPHIGFWQHVHDVDRDWMATLKRVPSRLGQLGDLHIGLDRRFIIPTAPNVVNIALKDIDHSRLLKDPSVFDKWDTENLLTAIRLAP